MAVHGTGSNASKDNDERSRRRGRRARQGLVIGAVIAGLVALGVGSASAAEPANDDRSVAVEGSDMHIEKSDLSINVMITNNSSYDLVWSGDKEGNDPVDGPSHPVLRPGETDFVQFKQSWTQGGLTIFPSWQVGDTGKFVYPAFSVPLVGFNGTVCSADEVSGGSPVKLTHCSIGGGYDPGAKVTIENR